MRWRHSAVMRCSKFMLRDAPCGVPPQSMFHSSRPSSHTAWQRPHRGARHTVSPSHGGGALCTSGAGQGELARPQQRHHALPHLLLGDALVVVVQPLHECRHLLVPPHPRREALRPHSRRQSQHRARARPPQPGCDHRQCNNATELHLLRNLTSWQLGSAAFNVVWRTWIACSPSSFSLGLHAGSRKGQSSVQSRNICASRKLKSFCDGRPARLSCAANGSWGHALHTAFQAAASHAGAHLESAERLRRRPVLIAELTHPLIHPVCVREVCRQAHRFPSRPSWQQGRGGRGRGGGKHPSTQGVGGTCFGGYGIEAALRDEELRDLRPQLVELRARQPVLCS